MENHASWEEFLDEFGKLSETRRLGLIRWGNFLAAGRGSYEHGEDLLAEVVSRVADGRRHWPRRVRISTFLARAMSSVASDDRDGLQGQAIHVDVDAWAAEGEADGRFAPSAESEAIAAERRELGRRAFGRAEERLAHDATALMLLESIALGERPAEIRERTGLGERELHAARKRAMERLKGFARGSQP